MIIHYTAEENTFVVIEVSKGEILKCHIKDCLEINDKQRIIKPKNGEYVKFKNFEKNFKKSPFTIYAISKACCF